MRIGHGYDIHQLVCNGHQEQFITLCGVKMKHKTSFIAHSDGDCAIHALCDALLGALALGDIGQHFPDTDPQYHNKNSGFFLKKINQIIQDKGYRLANADITIIAEKPKLQPHIIEMRENLAVLFECSMNQISVKATTHEKLDSMGENRSIAAHAVVLLENSHLKGK